MSGALYSTVGRLTVPCCAGEKRINKLVFIGKNLNRKELEDGFKSCLT